MRLTIALLTLSVVASLLLGISIAINNGGGWIIIANLILLIINSICAGMSIVFLIDKILMQIKRMINNE